MCEKKKETRLNRSPKLQKNGLKSVQPFLAQHLRTLINQSLQPISTSCRASYWCQWWLYWIKLIVSKPIFVIYSQIQSFCSVSTFLIYEMSSNASSALNSKKQFHNPASVREKNLPIAVYLHRSHQWVDQKTWGGLFHWRSLTPPRRAVAILHPFLACPARTPWQFGQISSSKLHWWSLN